MKYYLHDSNAFQDEKITELFINFGYEGLGLFYTILEKLAMQEQPIKTEVLKHQLKVGKKLEKCWKFMESLGIISSNNGETFNKQLLNFSEKYKIKSEKNAKRISEWRDKQTVAENVTRYEHVCNTSKVNRIEVNRIEVNKKEEKKDFSLCENLPVKSFEEIKKEDSLREENWTKLKNECWNSHTRLNDLAMKSESLFKSKMTYDEIRLKLADFGTLISSRGDIKENINDFFTHFVNWLCVQIKNGNKLSAIDSYNEINNSIINKYKN
ncbi:MAG: hypothetical protein OEL54_01655 [Flavobacteriaceae bacterium]|nr:hypothetical protein [Flavobacteriaceae bacterium]